MTKATRPTHQDTKAMRAATPRPGPRRAAKRTLKRATKRRNEITVAQEMFRKACGVKTDKVAHVLLTQAVHLLVWNRPDQSSLVEAFTRSAGLLAEIGPSSGLEALLAVQMIGVHEAATMFLYRANLDGQTPDGADANVLRAMRLMRLFNEQLVALAKLKGTTGQQRVTVEHVHVSDGGQAIVGAVSATKKTT